MELTKEEIEQIRWILLPENGHSAHYKQTELENLFENYLKTPLFTTEDGVDIFEGDEFWYTDLGTSQIFYKKSADVSFIPHTAFSTQAAAKEYFNDLPKYSLNQVTTAVNNWSLSDFIIGSDVIEEFLKNEKRNT